MVGSTSDLVGRIRGQVDDLYRQGYCFWLLGRDDREILVFTSSNIPQEDNVGDDTLYSQ